MVGCNEVFRLAWGSHAPGHEVMDGELHLKESSLNTSIKNPILEVMSTLGLDDESCDLHDSTGGTLGPPVNDDVDDDLALQQPPDVIASLVWRDLSVYCRIKDGSLKRLINNVSGCIKEGSLVALMGASGAGKSTLMSSLANRNPPNTEVHGEVLVGGRPLDAWVHHFSGYMHQEDIFVGSLTVLEHMNIMARLRMDRRCSARSRARRVHSLLHELGLQRARHTRIGRVGEGKVLSGGEKKRLAFATELIMNPRLLFCDEPTTGLDAYSARKLVRIMTRLAAGGRTVVCTIHQPSSDVFAMFDRFILLAEGRFAFCGKNKEALDFFAKQGYPCPASYNPGDFFVNTLAIIPGHEEASRRTVRRLCDRFAVSDAAQSLDLLVQHEFHMAACSGIDAKDCYNKRDFQPPRVWTKFFCLIYRYFLVVLRNPKVQFFRILQKIAIALAVGLCFAGTTTRTQLGVQAVQGALFLLISENTFAPMYAALAPLPAELPLLTRELHAGLYSAPLYYVARTVASLPGSILEPLLFVSVTYWLAGLRASAYAFCATAALATLVLCVASACGCFFSCAFESVPMAMAYLIPFDYSLMITSGLFVKLDTIPSIVSWIRYISWLMYANEAMSIIQWENVTNITCDPGRPEVVCLSSGDQVLDEYSFSADHLRRDFLALGALCLAFHALALLALIKRMRRK